MVRCLRRVFTQPGHPAAVMMLPNSDEKHGFIRSVKSEKAAVRFREIAANLTMQIRAGKSPGCVKTILSRQRLRKTRTGVRSFGEIHQERQTRTLSCTFCFRGWSFHTACPLSGHRSESNVLPALPALPCDHVDIVQYALSWNPVVQASHRIWDHLVLCPIFWLLVGSKSDPGNGFRSRFRLP